MIDVLVTVLAVAALLLAGLSVVMALVGRMPGWVEVIGAGVLELALLVQAIIAIVGMATGHRTEDTLTFVLYLLTSLFLLPAAIIWAAAEKSRWSSVVLAVAFLAVVVVVVRMQQVWVPGV